LTRKLDRRNFLKKTAIGAAALSAPAIVPSVVLGRNGNIAPSNKITMGCIGIGWQGGFNMESFLRLNDVRIIAACDVDANHLNQAKNKINKVNGNKDCAVYNDFRDLLARTDIDAVSLGLPDHWHSIPAIMAADSGKDIFGEKPLAHSIREGRAMVNAVKRNGRIWQTGSWQRSQAHFRFASELVRNGRIGKVLRVEVGLPSGHADFAGTAGQDNIVPPPQELDYDMWLGPAAWKPYIKARSHKNWRWDLDIGGGQILDWVGHHVDIAHWGLGFDTTGPVEIDGHGEYPNDGVYDTATKYWVESRYKDGTEMVIAGGYPEIKSGTKWIGEYGWVWVNRGDTLETYPKELKHDTIGPEEAPLFKSPGHWRNFIDCIRSRKETITPCETAHRSMSPGHLGQVSMLLGRKLLFDPETEWVLNDQTANEMLGYSMRSPWHIS
jgi:predicted dehydrogenase